MEHIGPSCRFIEWNEVRQHLLANQTNHSFHKTSQLTEQVDSAMSVVELKFKRTWVIPPVHSRFLWLSVLTAFRAGPQALRLSTLRRPD